MEFGGLRRAQRSPRYALLFADDDTRLVRSVSYPSDCSPSSAVDHLFRRDIQSRSQRVDNLLLLLLSGQCGAAMYRWAAFNRSPMSKHATKACAGVA